MFTLINKSTMDKLQLINKLTKNIVDEKERKNGVKALQITSTLCTAALNLAFVNESCKSSGQITKSQVIYRKLEGINKETIQNEFRYVTIRFLKLLKVFSRNRQHILSFDTTKEAFYGDVTKAEDILYLHEGSIARESDYYYEFLTVAITCNDSTRYILDGIIVPQGFYQEDYVSKMILFVKENITISLILFDRGFGTWGIIYELKKLNVNYLIFWKKAGDWYIEHFNGMKNGEIKRISRTEKYGRRKSKHNVTSDFILIKQHKYESKIFDWIFATNCNKKSAEIYIKLYKKRWGIETIYRVTDDIRIYTTSTKKNIRYFLFMFTCFVYNIWKFFQIHLGENFTLANLKTNMTIFMAKKGLIYPTHYDQFEIIANHFIICKK